METYKINLAKEWKTRDLRWNEFSILIKGISENTLLAKVIQARQMSISDINKKENRYFRDLKREYPLVNKTDNLSYKLNMGNSNESVVVNWNLSNIEALGRS